MRLEKSSKCKRVDEFICPSGSLKQRPTRKSFLSILKSSFILSGLHKTQNNEGAFI